MTINHDNQWYEVPTLEEQDKMKKEEKNKTYWDKERLEKFWGTNPKQEFNDKIDDDVISNNFESDYKKDMAQWIKERNEFFGIETPDISATSPNNQSKFYFKDIYESKKIRRFPSGAVRSDDTGRIRPDYLSPYGLAEIAEHFTVAKNDFGATNYFMGIEPKEILPSVMRHMLEFQEGIMKNDKDMVRSALRSLGANAIMGLHQIVLEEKGEYVIKYNGTELVEANEYLKELEDGKANG